LGSRYFTLKRSVLFLELPQDAALLSRGLEEAKSGDKGFICGGLALRGLVPLFHQADDIPDLAFCRGLEFRV
jgi:hypothetical protein